MAATQQTPAQRAWQLALGSVLIHNRRQLIRQDLDGHKVYVVFTPGGAQYQMEVCRGQILSVDFRPEPQMFYHNEYGMSFPYSPPPKPDTSNWPAVKAHIIGDVEDGEGGVVATYRYGRKGKPGKPVRFPLTWDTEWIGDESGASLCVDNISIMGGLQDAPLLRAVTEILNREADKRGW